MLVEPAKVCGRYQPLDYLRLCPQGIEECIQGLTALFARFELLFTLRALPEGADRFWQIAIGWHKSKMMSEEVGF